MQRPLVRSFRQLETELDPASPIVTLFSGGLDSSYLLLRLRQMGMTEVHAVSFDLGGSEPGDHRREIADALGVRLHVLDRREKFASSYVAPAIAAHATYLGVFPVSSTLSRPLIAQESAELADSLGAQAVIHTANRSQNSMRRLNGALGLMGYRGAYGSPYDLDPVDRDEKHRALREAGLDLLSGRSVSGDSNLWCREFESGIIDDPEEHSVPEELYRWSVLGVPTDPRTLSVSFESGVPVALNDQRMPLVDLIGVLNDLVGQHGLGRYSGLEHLDSGEKVLEFREMPAAWLLLQSYRHVEAACCPAELIREKQHLEQVWVREALEGRWFGPLHHAAQRFIESCAQHVTGRVSWLLRTGGAETRSITTPRPLYLRDREAWEARSIAAETGRQTPARPVPSDMPRKDLAHVQ
ncbi:argininosuccinate synthase-related protein [Lentzea sp. JNUCC 0626]|uniref:argininosuccinate synthase-related protein n=1 Tax=Lentzea sp. JNUCC 0626 TaxID=3367513 RepID=UPI003748616D